MRYLFRHVNTDTREAGPVRECRRHRRTECLTVEGYVRPSMCVRTFGHDTRKRQASLFFVSRSRQRTSVATLRLRRPGHDPHPNFFRPHDVLEAHHVGISMGATSSQLYPISAAQTHHQSANRPGTTEERPRQESKKVELLSRTKSAAITSHNMYIGIRCCLVSLSPRTPPRHTYRVGGILVGVRPPPLLPLPQSQERSDLVTREDAPVARGLPLGGGEPVSVRVVGYYERHA